MKNGAAIWVFLASGMVILGQCAAFHVHGWRAVGISFFGAPLVTYLTRRFWLRLDQPFQRPPRSFADPTLGNRAARRAERKRHHHR